VYDPLREQYIGELQRTTEMLLPYLKDPLPYVVAAPGGSLQDLVRGSLVLPAWQPFAVGGARRDVPDGSAGPYAWNRFVVSHCPDLGSARWAKIQACLATLHTSNPDLFENIRELLSLAPTPDVDGYQYDWWTGRAPTISEQMRSTLLALIDESLATPEALFAGVFLAINFRMLLVSMVNCEVNDPRFYQQFAPSPFVYMMA